MRLFDLAGTVFVAAWVLTVGVFLIYGADDSTRSISLSDGVIDLTEDTAWLNVHRGGEDIGIFREDRTRLIDGWLIETQGIVELALTGDTYPFRFSSRSTLNTDLTLRNATGNIEAFGKHLQMHGHVDETDGEYTFHVTITADDSATQFVADLDDRPRLSSHAIAQMLASEDLEAGVHFEQQFFDPLTLSPSNVRLVYDGREEISNAYFTDGVQAHSFGQSVGNFHSRIYTDDSGMVIRQVLPMQIALARVPDPIGRSNFEEFRELFEDQSGRTPPFINAIDTDDLLALVARFGGGEMQHLREAEDGEVDDISERDTREYAISNLEDAGELDLMSPRQHIAYQTSREARVETGVNNSLWHAGLAPSNSLYIPLATADDHDLLAELTEDKSDISPMELAAKVADHCPDELAWNPSMSWPTSPAKSPESALECLALTADAMSEYGTKPHFVHGVIDRDGSLVPAVWFALYSDGEYLGEFDPLAAGGEVTKYHIQLYIDDRYHPARLPELVDRIALY